MVSMFLTFLVVGCFVARNPSSVLSRNRKTELRITIQKIWQVAWDQWEHRNAILHNSENLVTQAEAVMIASRVQMELENWNPRITSR
jgi:hypothetical protein